MTDDRDARRQLDVASLFLLLVGLACGAWSYWLITHDGFDPLVIVPSVVAATTGGTHVFKRVAR